jgi:ABC-2 type transport system ATP-binding protein
MQSKAIQVKGLQKSYKQLHVLKGVDFEVEKGSIFALLGSNGAGKTTIIKILTTLLKQDGGTAIVNGFDVASQPDDVRQSISLTGQFAAVDEILTGRENLILISRLRHLKNPHQLADDLLNRFGRRRPQGFHLFGRHAPQTRHCHEPGRETADHFPRRADHRA